MYITSTPVVMGFIIEYLMQTVIISDNRMLNFTKVNNWQYKIYDDMKDETRNFPCKFMETPIIYIPSLPV